MLELVILRYFYVENPKFEPQKFYRASEAGKKKSQCCFSSASDFKTTKSNWIKNFKKPIWRPIETTLFYTAGQLSVAKAELPLEGIFFPLYFLPWEFLIVKKLEIGKTKTTKYTTFKTDIIKVVLVFSISNFFTNENTQGRKLSTV